MALWETYLKTQFTETEGGTMGDLLEDTVYRDRGWHYGRPSLQRQRVALWETNLKTQFTETEGGTMGDLLEDTVYRDRGWHYGRPT